MEQFEYNTPTKESGLADADSESPDLFFSIQFLREPDCIHGGKCSLVGCAFGNEDEVNPAVALLHTLFGRALGDAGCDA